MKNAILLSVTLLIGLSIGFVVGARVGTYEYLLADGQYKVSVLAHQLRALKAGKLDFVITDMEISSNA